MKTSSAFSLVITLAAFALLTPMLQAADGPYHFLKEIAVAGDGSWDYLSTAKFEAAPPQTDGAPRQRPKVVPGTFKGLVFGMGR